MSNGKFVTTVSMPKFETMRPRTACFNLEPDTCLPDITSNEINLLVGGKWVRKLFWEAGTCLPELYRTLHGAKSVMNS